MLTVGRRKREGQISHGRKGLTRSTPWQEGGKEEKREAKKRRGSKEGVTLS